MSDILKQAMEKRAKHRGLKVDFERMRYFNSALFEDEIGVVNSNTLYVGCGHGHDALLALLDGLTQCVVGVDPYISGHGNNDEDYRLLGEIIDELDLAGRFAVKRMLIQDYLEETDQKFDRIVINDVLHHIFVTDERLTKSDLFSDAVELFASLSEVLTDDGALLIADVGRHGFRQYVHRVARPLGVSHFQGNYTHKQQWNEWDAAVQKGGWRLMALRNYVPYGLREHSNMLGGALGRATLCDKYFLTYRK
jgi:SAM-dependent methyltransferase